MANESSNLQHSPEPPPADATKSVEAFLAWDHRRLDGLFADAVALAERGDAAGALAPYGAFESGLELHIAAEEEVMFPVFEENTGMREAGPSAVMRREHVEIRSLLGAMRAALAAGDAKGFGASARSLEELLSMHNRKEEQMLYPSIDQIAEAEGLTEELVQRSRVRMNLAG